MIWLAEEIERIYLESPDDKIMILSQWTSMLDLVDVRHLVFEGRLTGSDWYLALGVPRFEGLRLLPLPRSALRVFAFEARADASAVQAT